jgi:DeoR/GlpR family transcriptional regulator of sugar metabolism
MLKMKRQAYILHRINLHNGVFSGSLSREINVLEDTIRRDSGEQLSESYQVIKINGVILSISFNQVYYSPATTTYSQIHKKAIVLKAVTFKSFDILISELPANDPVFERIKNLELLLCKR